ncbi:hypothetical protein CHS0354_003868 [Potamilus streckersoni]|uniref:IRS-type PTB domain-containing protein n=1 Tax=Potamilus streckersoni TaxID=2493646 RepID=A0AAE0TIY2_9BIVA|nr:hypothetical protein CHS0354_003868 [Potamilus streckersoni]
MDKTRPQTYINTSVAKECQGLDSASGTGISDSYNNLYEDPEQSQLYDNISEENNGLDAASTTGPYTNLNIEPEGSQLYDQISEENNETIFDVEVCDTEAAKRCRFHGHYKLILRETSICLLGTSHRVAYSWPLETIRLFGFEHGEVFFMEAGRRAPSGEGLIKFKANRARDIYDYVMANCKQKFKKT